MDPGRDAQQTRRRPAIALIVALVVAAVSVAVAVSCGPPEVTAGKADAGDHSSFQRYGRAKVQRCRRCYVDAGYIGGESR